MFYISLGQRKNWVIVESDFLYSRYSDVEGFILMRKQARTGLMFRRDSTEVPDRDNITYWFNVQA
jgi:hypothetical protein